MSGWKLLRWKVRNEIGKNEVGKFETKFEAKLENFWLLNLLILHSNFSKFDWYFLLWKLSNFKLSNFSFFHFQLLVAISNYIYPSPGCMSEKLSFKSRIRSKTSFWSSDPAKFGCLARYLPNEANGLRYLNLYLLACYMEFRTFDTFEW